MNIHSATSFIDTIVRQPNIWSDIVSTNNIPLFPADVLQCAHDILSSTRTPPTFSRAALEHEYNQLSQELTSLQSQVTDEMQRMLDSSTLDTNQFRNTTTEWTTLCAQLQTLLQELTTKLPMNESPYVAQTVYTDGLGKAVEKTHQAASRYYEMVGQLRQLRRVLDRVMDMARGMECKGDDGSDVADMLESVPKKLIDIEKRLNVLQGVKKNETEATKIVDESVCLEHEQDDFSIML
jgi:DNA repair ATPase RecN